MFVKSEKVTFRSSTLKGEEKRFVACWRGILYSRSEYKKQNLKQKKKKTERRHWRTTNIVGIIAKNKELPRAERAHFITSPRDPHEDPSGYNVLMANNCPRIRGRLCRGVLSRGA